MKPFEKYSILKETNSRYSDSSTFRLLSSKGGAVMDFWTDEGLIGSICRHCSNWIFNDWYMCPKAPINKVDKNLFLILPIEKCNNFLEQTKSPRH